MSLGTAKNGGLPKIALVATVRSIDVTATQSALNPADAAQIFLHQCTVLV